MPENDKRASLPILDGYMDELHERIQKDQFRLGAKRPLSWKGQAYKLKHAADSLFEIQYAAYQQLLNQLLERMTDNVKRRATDEPLNIENEYIHLDRDIDLISVYFLLMGYALENLLKAICMIKHPEYFTPEKLTVINTHNLNNLCSLCQINLRQDEINLLDKLTEYVEWRGKYPIPLRVDKMLPKKLADGTWKEAGEPLYGLQTKDELDTLFSKFLQVLESLDIS